MTVSDLIKTLEAMPQDALVIVDDNRGNYDDAYGPYEPRRVKECGGFYIDTKEGDLWAVLIQ